MITKKAFFGLCKAIDQIIPPECHAALVILHARPLPGGGYDVEMEYAALADGPADLRRAVALALRTLADDLVADARASDEPE